MQVRCLHCHEPIDVPDEGDLSRVHCPACGGSFSLVGESTASVSASQTRKLAHFELIEQVGVGAFGSVWKARDTRLDRIVAVKIPRAGRLDGEEAEMFLREARAAAQLQHPSIVPVHEVGREDDTLYIVSDFVHGATLDDWLTARRLTPREAAELCLAIAEALDHAHQADVVHRDLKPGNIMLDLSGRPHLLDFGLARRAGREATMTVEGRVLGTPAYMSPEQAHGDAHTADHRTDIYSLGVVLFRLLTGELPFRGSVQMVMVQKQREDAPSLHRLNSRIPRDLETICLKCLERDPHKRYPTAAALADDLRRFLVGEPIEARPITRLARGWRWCKRKPMVAGLSAVVLGLLLAIGIAGPLVAWQEAKSAQKNRRLRYLAEMNMAGQAWDENDVARTQLLVDSWKPASGDDDLRGFEWFYLAALLRRYEESYANIRRTDASLASTGFTWTTGATFVAESANGVLAAAFGDSVRLYDIATGAEIDSFPTKSLPERRAEPHLSAPQSWHWAFPFVAISRDGRYLAYRDDDPEVLLVRDLELRRVVARLPGHTGYVRAASFDRDGRRIVSASGNGRVSVWDLSAPERPIQSREYAALVRCVAFSHFSEGGLVATGLADDSSIRLWTPDSGEDVTLRGHYFVPSTMPGVLSITFTPDGQFLVSGGSDRSVRIWDLKTREVVHVLEGHTDEVRSVAVSPDGNLVASGSRDHSIRIWNLKTGRLHAVLRGHDHIVQSLTFTSEGRKLVSCGQDGIIKLWADVDPLDPDLVWCDGAVVGLACSADGRTIAAIEDCSTRIRFGSFPSNRHHAEAARIELGCLPEAVALFRSDLCAVACVDGSVKLLRLSSGEILRTEEGRSAERATENNRFAFSSDGSWLALGCTNGTVRVWNVSKDWDLDEFVLVKRDPSQVRCLAFGGERLYAGYQDGEVLGWNLETGAPKGERLLDQGSEVSSIAVSKNGETVATGQHGGIGLWRSLHRSRLPSLIGGRTHGAILFLDDQTIVSSGGELAIRLWDLEHRRVKFTFYGHTGAVRHLCVSEDGRTIVSGGLEGAIHIWRAPRRLD